MRAEYVSWTEVKAKARHVDPRSEEERAAGRAAAAERREAYVRGHHLVRAVRWSAAEPMVRDYLALDTGADPESFTVTITPEVPGGPSKEIAQIG